jgi:hypothetical protein
MKARDAVEDISSIASRGASQATRHSRQETGFRCASQAEPRPTATDQQASRPQTRATCQAPGGGSRPGLGSQRRKTMNHEEYSPAGRRRLAEPGNPGLREHP